MGPKSESSGWQRDFVRTAAIVALAFSAASYVGRDDFELVWILECLLVVLASMVPLLVRRDRLVFAVFSAIVGALFLFFGILFPPYLIVGLLLILAAFPIGSPKAA